MKFNYQARTREGILKLGQVEASSYEAALEVLQGAGLYVTLLEEKKAQPLLAREIKFLQRVTRREVAILARELAILLNSETPIVESLHTLAVQTTNSTLKEKLLNIAAAVEGGKLLSQALSLHPSIFSGFFVSMVRAGEVSGDLPGSLNTLAEYLEREYDIVSKIRGAMLYPAFVLTVMIIMITLMFYFVFPELEKVFKETDRALPFITTLMLALGAFVRKWGWLILLLLAGGIVFLLRYGKTEEGRRTLDTLFLKLPIFGSFVKKIFIARFSQTLSTLIQGGLPIAQALEISGQVVGNHIYRRILFATRDAVRRGESLSSVFKRYPDFTPPMVSQMVFVGERTGRLDETLTKMSEFYKQDVDREIARFIGLLEPALIVILGGLVTFVILTILLPIYQIGFGG